MDIKLSKRMQAVADMVDGENVADIGCDHAFVSIYLAGKPFVKKVIAMDVKTGPVDIAKANVAAYNLENKIEIRMSDGFGNLEVGEADVAVIAGMGGYLMIDILKNGISRGSQMDSSRSHLCSEEDSRLMRITSEVWTNRS